MKTKALEKIGFIGKVADAPLEYFKDLGIPERHIPFLKDRYGHLQAFDGMNAVRLQGAARARDDMKAIGSATKKIGKGLGYTALGGGALGTAAYAANS